MVSNLNEVIRVVLNSLFFLQKDFTHTQKHKSTKAQRRNQVKAQNAISEKKIKNTLKKHLRGKKSPIRLFAFLCL